MYSPKINEKHIPVLYRLGKELKKPMTSLVNEAISDYLAKSRPSMIDSCYPSI